MSRKPIPEWSGFTKSFPCDPPSHVLDLQRSIRAECHRRKRAYNKLLRAGPLSKNPVAVYSLGPFHLPLDCFTSSRWTERRTNLPLPVDRKTWKIAWEYWRGAASYRFIKANIEKHGMRRPIIADWTVNYDPDDSTRIVHEAFAFNLRNLEWPFLILRTGNERLLMAMFEWGWRTIPTVISVRDVGQNKAFSAFLKLFVEASVGTGIAGASKDILRRVEDKR